MKSANTWDVIETWLTWHCGTPCWYGCDGCHIHNEHNGFQYTWDSTDPDWLLVENVRFDYRYCGRNGKKRYVYLRPASTENEPETV